MSRSTGGRRSLPSRPRQRFPRLNPVCPPIPLDMSSPTPRMLLPGIRASGQPEGEGPEQNLAAQSAALNAAQLNPSGVDTITTFLMSQPFLKMPSERHARAMAFGYLSAGAHDDNRHIIGSGRHPEYRTAREGAEEGQVAAMRQSYLHFLYDSVSIDSNLRLSTFQYRAAHHL